MTNKTLAALNKKYDELNIGNFDLDYSEILFYSTLNALEFYIKKISKINELNANNECKEEFDYLKKSAAETYELGLKILESSHNRERLDLIKDFYKKYAQILVFGEEITF